MSELNDILFEFLSYLPQTSAGKPFLCEWERDISLHFNYSAIQSHMRKAEPDKLTLGYTRTMMGFLLFQPKPERIAMIGLGEAPWRNIACAISRMRTSRRWKSTLK